MPDFAEVKTLEATTATIQKKRVAMVVLDSVITDSRVLKEADTMSLAGYDVMVFGIKDIKIDADLILRDTGTRILLADWRPATFRAIGRIFNLFGLLAVVILAGLAYSLNPILQSVGGLAALAWRNIAFFPYVIVGGVAVFFANRAARKANIVALRLTNQKIEFGFFRRWWKLATNPKQVIYRLVSNEIIESEILEHLEEFNPVALHCHDFSTLPLGVRFKRKHPKVKLIYDSHEIYCERPNYSEYQKVKIRQAQRRASKHVDAFITVNQSVAHYLLRAYPKLPTPCIVRNASPFRDKPVEYDGRLHKRLGIPSDTKIILYHGGIVKVRNLEMLLDAARLLPPDIHVVLMGWGNHAEDLEAKAKEIPNCHIIPGVPQEELHLWTAGSWLGVLPYSDICLNHKFCSPNKMWEYPSSGVPIIAANLVELVATIKEYNIGWLCGLPMTAQNLVECVMSITPDEHKAKVDACFKFQQLDCWEVYAQRLTTLYREQLA